MTSKPFSWSTTGDEVVQAFADRVKGRTFLITGASANSIGAETAITLARHGSPAQIILPGRSQSKIDPVIATIKDLNPEVKVKFVPLDLSSPSSVRAAAAQILSDPEVEKIDVLINCAGVMVCPYTAVPEFKDKQGRPLERQFATNHVGHFLFTNLLLEKVRKAAPGARIVNVSSSGHRLGGIRWDDVGFENGKVYDVWDAYGQSKTGNILMAAYLASKIPSHEVASFSLHPGNVPSELQRYMTPEMLQDGTSRIVNDPDFEDIQRKTQQQGVATGLVAALDPALQAHSGAYLSDCQIKTPAEHARGQDNAERLWKLSEEIVGQEFHI